jgi:hypothetical protein
MALPTGWTVHVNGFFPRFGGGQFIGLHVDYDVLDPQGSRVGGDSYVIGATAPLAQDLFTGDGATLAFTTRTRVFKGDPTLVIVSLAGVVQSSGFGAVANADDTVTVTFTVAPAAGAAVVLSYPVGAGLDIASVRDIVNTLSLVATSGTVYAGSAGSVSVATAHQGIDGVLQLLHAWARARILADRFA